MTRPLSLRTRIALIVGATVTALWLLAAAVTSSLLIHETDRLFDSDLSATARRILPIVLHDWGEKDERSRGIRPDGSDGSDEIDVRRMHGMEDNIAFVVRAPDGTVLLRSTGADLVAFPPVSARGFSSDDRFRFFTDRGRDGVTISVAEPLRTRREVARGMLWSLILPPLLVIPLSLLAIALVVRRSFAPVERLRAALAARGPQDLSPLPDGDMVPEIAPMVASVNGMMTRLAGAFEAERSFAANAAHELRTPVAGAIAQAQRLQAETADGEARARAGEIETTLKRLNRYSEKLMQLARAEGSRLRLDHETDLTPVARIIAEDIQRLEPGAQIELSLPATPAMSDLDPDAFGILLRNLLENALRHGRGPVSLHLSTDCVLTVSNDGPAVAAEDLARLSQRFSRGNGAGDGTGLGLAIVNVIAERSGGAVELTSPRPGTTGGMEVRFRC